MTVPPLAGGRGFPPQMFSSLTRGLLAEPALPLRKLQFQPSRKREMSLHNRRTFGAFGWDCRGEGFVLKCAARGREVAYLPDWGPSPLEGGRC